MLHQVISESDMVNAIVELLKQNNRVIVPNFGAFIISQGSNGKVLFNNFLSFNDGLLIGHFCQVKGMQKSDALIEVNNFVESIRSSLDSKGEYVMPNLGSFTRDHHNVLRFMQDIDLHLSDYPAFEAPTPSSTPSSAPSAKELLDIDMNASFEKKDEEYKVDLPKPRVSNSNLLTIDVDKSSETPSSKPIDDADTNFDKAVKEDPAPYSAPSSASAAKSVNPRYYQPDKASKGHKDQAERKKRSMGWFVLIFVLIPVLALVVYVGFYQDRFGWVKAVHNLMVTEKGVETPKAEEPAKVDATKTEPTPVDPSSLVKPEPAAPETRPAAENSLVPTASAANGFHYQIIVSTKNSESDAQAYAGKLKEKGFSNAIVLQRKGKFLVSIDGANDLVEAEAKQEQIVTQHRIESYVLTLK